MWTAARFARPSVRYETVVEFYRDLVGLEVRGSFADHSGYDGTIFGVGAGVELEITRHRSGRPIPAPTEEDLLVFYFEDGDARRSIERRLAASGYEPIELANPFWEPDSTGYLDPDGWIVVLTTS